MNRISILQQTALQEADYFLIFNSTNIIYYTSFPGAAALAVPQKGKATLYVAPVNFEQAKAEVKGVDVQLLKRGENLMQKIADQTGSKAAKYAVDSLPVESWRTLAKAVGGEEQLEVSGKRVIDARKVKDPQEITLIKQACKLAMVGMEVAAEAIKPGVKERQVAAEVEYAMRQGGSDGTSFDTIIASGPSSAFPHGSCSDRTINEGDMVVVDLGATFNFYRSDMTRTFVAGKPSDKQQKIYDSVKMAQEKAFQIIRPNIAAKEVDAAARQSIIEAGFGEFFVHNLGHGVGLEIHEAPVLSIDSKDTLAARNVVTDEPGIYLPGYGGVRIEDTIVVTAKGAERLTSGFIGFTGHP